MQADVGWVEQELNEVRGDCRVVPEERDEARADYAKLLESSTAVADNLREDIRQLRSQLETERAVSQQVQAQLDRKCEELEELKRNPSPEIELPEPADLLNQLKARRKKCGTTLADVEEIWEILKGDCG